MATIILKDIFQNSSSNEVILLVVYHHGFLDFNFYGKLKTAKRKKYYPIKN